MSYDINEEFNVSFLKPGVHLWNKAFLENMIKFLKKYQTSNNEISEERCFTEYLLEIEQAYSAFLKKINDLPIMMKCRVKGDDKAHFGGQECAELVRAMRTSSEKYLMSTNFKDNNEIVNEKEKADSNKEPIIRGIYDLASKVRDLARTDENAAKEIEAKVHQEYVSLGKDHTLDALKEAGYSFDNVSL